MGLCLEDGIPNLAQGLFLVLNLGMLSGGAHKTMYVAGAFNKVCRNSTESALTLVLWYYPSAVM